MGAARSIHDYTIKPVETDYNGIRYRSRTEARWALFLDVLGLPHHYEVETFDLKVDNQQVLYSPDFWLPKQDCWLEIKGEEPDELACEKASLLAMASSKDVYVFFGGHTLPDSPEGSPKAYAFFPDGSGDYEYFWCQCPDCKAFGIKFEGRADRLPCKECALCEYYQDHPFLAEQHRAECTKVGGCPRHGGNGDKGYSADAPAIVEAIKAARAKRWFR